MRRLFYVRRFDLCLIVLEYRHWLDSTVPTILSETKPYALIHLPGAGIKSNVIFCTRFRESATWFWSKQNFVKHHHQQQQQSMQICKKKPHYTFCSPFTTGGLIFVKSVRPLIATLQLCMYNVKLWSVALAFQWLSFNWLLQHICVWWQKINPHRNIK